MAREEEDHAAFDDEDDDLEDTEGDDSDMEEEFDDDEGAAATVTVTDGAYPESSVPSTSTNPGPNIPNPPPTQNGTVSVPIQSLPAIAAPDPKRQRIEEKNPPPVTPPPTLPTAAPPSAASLEDSRRLFQRLWTDDDEIKILKGFLEFTSSRGTTFASHQYDTGPFYEQIKNQLQLDFNKNQLIEKLRRLKKKYRNTATRMANHGREFAFKSPHEKATYEIARKIWSASTKRSRDNSDEDDLNPYANSNSAAAAASVNADRQIARSRRRGRKRALDTIPVAPSPIQVMPALPALMPPPPPVLPAGTLKDVVKVEVQTAPAPVINQMPAASPAPPPAIPTIIEETVKSCLSPIFKELLNSAVSVPVGSVGFGLMGSVLLPMLSFGAKSVDLSDDRWKQQQILELEVYLKRVELVRDQIKSTLEELKLPAPILPPSPAGDS